MVRRMALLSDSATTMLKFELGTHSPATAKVIANHQNYMWDIESAMTWVVGVLLGACVSLPRIAVEVACHHRLAIATKGETRGK